MENLKSIATLLELNTGSFLITSSVDLLDSSFAASLFLDNSENGIALVASGKGETVGEAVDELLQEIE